MATIRKRNNKYQAQVRLRGIKPISKSFTKKADAVAWARVIESEVTQGTYTDPRAAESATLAQVIDKYKDYLDSHESARAIPALQSRLRSIRVRLGAFSLHRISTQRVAEFQRERAVTSSAATVIHDVSLLLRLLRFAQTDLGIRLPQGIPQVRLPKMPHGRVRRISEEEEQRLLDACSGDEVLRSLVVLALETAMRRSELVAMRWCDINWAAHTLTIPKTKTGIPRTIPLSDVALSTLERIEQTGEYVFSISVGAVSQRFSRACKKAGITDLRFHDLRHSAVSAFFEMGLNQMEVAAISGHKSVAMLSRYTHIRPEHLANRLRGISGIAFLAHAD